MLEIIGITLLVILYILAIEVVFAISGACLTSCSGVGVFFGFIFVLLGLGMIVVPILYHLNILPIN